MVFQLPHILDLLVRNRNRPLAVPEQPNHAQRLEKLQMPFRTKLDTDEHVTMKNRLGQQLLTVPALAQRLVSRMQHLKALTV